MEASSTALGRRLLDAIDLAIELATLGEYGLQPIATGHLGDEHRLRPVAARRPRDQSPYEHRPSALACVTSTGRRPRGFLPALVARPERTPRPGAPRPGIAARKEPPRRAAQ